MRFFLAFMLGMTSIAIAEHTALTDANWNTVRRLFMTVVRRIGAEPPHLASTAESEIRFLAHMAHRESEVWLQLRMTQVETDEAVWVVEFASKMCGSCQVCDSPRASWDDRPRPEGPRIQ